MATADAPLKLNFSFIGLGNTKSMGLANLVINGTLTGAASQTVKYALNTMVVPADAGTITRDPDLSIYKEGSEEPNPNKTAHRSPHPQSLRTYPRLQVG